METPIDTALDRLVEWHAVPAPAVDNESGLPYATHEGVLRIGDSELKLVVLNTGQRLITQESLNRFFGV
jgi:hypothetical protein